MCLGGNSSKNNSAQQVAATAPPPPERRQPRDPVAPSVSPDLLADPARAASFIAGVYTSSRGVKSPASVAKPILQAGPASPAVTTGALANAAYRAAKVL